MQYRMGKHGEQISLLGYGCMRFTRSGGGIDLDKAERELMAAIDAGVNYLDTAYIYPGSEAAVGEILRRNQCRDRVLIATKLPQYLIRSRKGIDRCFDEELKRLCTDHVDFYLMHMLADVSAWEKLRSFGIEEWIAEKKASGQIRNIGFSFHGGTAAFLEVLSAYDWDFCQIQYNYMDETTQAGRRGLETAAARGIPVIIMEPLRGGRLANQLPPAAKELLEKEGKGRSAAEWGLRWLWDQPGVTCVLSGMNSLEMVAENCRIASEARAGEFTEEDRALIAGLKREISGALRVGCTGCGYCQPCPRGVDIPGVFRCWNEVGIDGKGKACREYMQTTAMRRQSTGVRHCVGCGKCEQHCPQHLDIRKELKRAAAELETPAYRIVEQAYRLLKI
ncbi:aldo/keto reductase [Dysosmobacter sp. HCP28S3_G4]|uniref:aldo/keto reductase n=1 Tax=Dysosmobacter sp. HCP28S3_G4 TaxID=3438938 RepID=UPI003F891852